MRPGSWCPAPSGPGPWRTYHRKRQGHSSRSADDQVHGSRLPMQYPGLRGGWAPFRNMIFVTSSFEKSRDRPGEASRVEGEGKPGLRGGTLDCTRLGLHSGISRLKHFSQVPFAHRAMSAAVTCALCAIASRPCRSDDTEASWDESSDVPEPGAATTRLCTAATLAGPGNLGPTGADSA